MLNNYLCDFLSQEILKDAKKLLTRDELVVLHFIILDFQRFGTTI